MKACDIYRILVGGAGIAHRQLMYEMVWWQIVAAINGYYERSHALWESTRWHTWCMLRALGSEIESPADMMKFPWDKEAKGDLQPTEDEIMQLQAEIQRLNNR